MTIKRQLRELIPAFLLKSLLIRRESRRLGRLSKLPCDDTNLAPASGFHPQKIFSARDNEARWGDSRSRLDRFTIPDLSGGVNPGDRRAIYYLIAQLRPTAVLEIGTHIGASTVHIAEGLRDNQRQHNIPAELVTVDVVDVNDAISKPWRQYGATHSPREMVQEMGYEDFVEFIHDGSLHYMANCGREFDFIFLDGDHGASTVYQEIPAALNVLRKPGVILMHDYFPDLKPLWSNGSVIPGPFLATRRYREEGANLAVLPLGDLPWPTKLASNLTSLALLLKN